MLISAKSQGSWIILESSELRILQQSLLQEGLIFSPQLSLRKIPVVQASWQGNLQSARLRTAQWLNQEVSSAQLNQSNSKEVQWRTTPEVWEERGQALRSFKESRIEIEWPREPQYRGIAEEGKEVSKDWTRLWLIEEILEEEWVTLLLLINLFIKVRRVTLVE